MTFQRQIVPPIILHYSLQMMGYVVQNEQLLPTHTNFGICLDT